MTREHGYLVGFSALVLAAAVLVWSQLVMNFEWHIVQQFWGHLGPSAFLVALGVAAIMLHQNLQKLFRIEGWLAVAAGVIYVLADTFIMHPPWGIFDGAGKAEEEHVMLMGLFAVLGASGLLMQRRMGENFSPSIHFVIGGVAAVMVFVGHHQHTVAGTMAHNATLVTAAVAIGFRVMNRMTEYAMAMIVTGFIFFSSQMGFAMYVDMSGNSAGAWIAGWAMAGFLAATIYVLLATGPQRQPAE